MDMKGWMSCVSAFVLVWIGTVVCQNSTDNSTVLEECDQVSVYNILKFRPLDGVYLRMDPAIHTCNNNRSIYRKPTPKGEQYFLYFVNGGWNGWMIGKNMCKNKGYVSVTDSALTVRDIKAPWEEFDGFSWVFNERVVIGCLGEVDYVPWKTRPVSTVTPPVTFTGAPHPTNPSAKTTPDGTNQGGTRSLASRHEDEKIPMHVIFLLYVLVPIGCLVILILIVIVIKLYHESNAFKQKKSRVNATDNMAVRFNNILARAQEQQHAQLSREVSIEATSDEAIGQPPSYSGEGVYDFLHQCTSGSIGRASGQGFNSYEDKFGSWRSSKALVK